jgi:hypothetical protein
MGMPAIKRQNAIGLEYTLAEYNVGKSTIITLRNRRTPETPLKSIVVPVPLEELNQAWYNWAVKGDYVQVAFNMLTNEQREFLMTGITPVEWDAMFKEENS